MSTILGAAGRQTPQCPVPQGLVLLNEPSLAEIVWLPAVVNVAEKLAMPATSATLVGTTVCGLTSVLVNATVLA